MTIKSLLPLSFLALAACSFEPVSGDYVFTTTGSESDCPQTDTGDTGGETEDYTMAVAVNEEKTTMTLGSGDSAMDCTLDGKSFDCPIDDIVMDGADYGMDYLYTVAMTFGGSWSGNDAFDWSSTAAMTCEGADCETYNMTSCSSSGEGEATLSE